MASLFARRVLAFLPTGLWMALIFSFSSVQEPRFSSVGLTDLAIKKAGHFALYMVLAFALAFALDRSLAGSRFGRWTLGLALGVAILFAVSDELHQVFTPTRDPSLADVGIDAVGAIVGLWAWRQLRRWRGRRSVQSRVKSSR
jgi:hypothetical protein